MGTRAFNEKQKVLIVHNYYQIPGGEDAVVMNEKEMLEHQGHEVILYCRDNSELKSMSMLKKMALPFLYFFNPRTYRDVKKIIKDQKINVVHVHNTLSLVSPAVYYAALRCKIPVIQTIHNFRLLCPGATFYRDGHVCEDCVKIGLRCAVKHRCYRGSKIETLVCVICTKIHRLIGIYGKLNYICLTEFNKQKLLSLTQINPNRVFVKPNFAMKRFDLKTIVKKKGQFVYAGRLDETKGIQKLLEAWKYVCNEIDATLVICGTGSLEEWCCEYVKTNQISNVDIKGYKSHEEVMRIIAGASAVVLPTQLYEGFPMTVVEAYCMETPVIGSNIGNTASIIKDGETGIYLLMPVLEPGYYHFMLGAEPDKDIPKDTDMNYVYYYQFTPE